MPTRLAWRKALARHIRGSANAPLGTSANRQIRGPTHPGKAQRD